MANLSGLNPGAANPNPNKSFEVLPAPSDSVSSLSFSPKANYLVATSWDNQVRCWEILPGSSQPKASISHDFPVLCSTWKDDGTTVFSGGCDKLVKMWPLMSGGQPTQVAAHDAPIKEMAWIQQMNLLVTGSWDKTLRYWDTRQAQPVHTQQLPERCYALTVLYPLMVVGTADRHLIIYNLQNPQTEFKRITSPLKYQTRCLAAFPDQQGFLVGSIEGRVGVHHLDDAQQSKNFTFKCHREGNEIYSVNSLNFHPVHHTFATAGSDGAFNFWDKDSKQRLKNQKKVSIDDVSYRVICCTFVTHLKAPSRNTVLFAFNMHPFCNVITGILFQNQREEQWLDALILSRAALSTMMDQFLHMRFAMTGARVLKIIIRLQQRHISIFIAHWKVRLKGSLVLELVVESEPLGDLNERDTDSFHCCFICAVSCFSSLAIMHARNSGLLMLNIIV